MTAREQKLSPDDYQKNLDAILQKESCVPAAPPVPSAEARRREEFEKWAAAQGDSIARHCKDHYGKRCHKYNSTFTHWEWLAWQAAYEAADRALAPLREQIKYADLALGGNSSIELADRIRTLREQAERLETVEANLADYARRYFELFDMYMRSWLRNIGGVIRHKHHQIDGFALRTQDIYEKAKLVDRMKQIMLTELKKKPSAEELFDAVFKMLAEDGHDKIPTN